MEIVTVVGNGTSIVFTPELEGRALARRVAEGLPPSLDVLISKAARRARPDGSRATPRENFEHLLGPLDRMGAALGPLADVATALGDVSGAKAVADARDLIRNLYLRGVGVTLGVVAKVSRATHGPALDRYSEFVEWVFDRCPSGPATFRFFNLNYDGLLDARVLELAGTADVAVADQADGRCPTTLYPVGDKYPVHGLALREPAEPEYVVRDRMAQLYHLHGSIGWLRAPSGEVYKADRLEAVRRSRFFEKVASRTTAYEPVVVLTDRKAAETLREPFATAYSRLTASLQTADRVIIAGYGLGDVPLNSTLARAFADRADDLPRVAFFGYERAGSAGLRARVLRNLAPNESVRSKLDRALTLRANGLPADLASVATWGT